MISHFSPGCPISCLAERHILYQVIRVHEERTAINQHRQIRIRIIVQFLRYRNVLFAFDTHGWTDSIADHGYVMWQEGIRFLCVNFLVIFRLIHIKASLSLYHTSVCDVNFPALNPADTQLCKLGRSAFCSNM